MVIWYVKYQIGELHLRHSKNIFKNKFIFFNQVPAITVVIAGYMGCNAEAAVIMFTISIGFNGMTVPGSKSSMLDFAPKYSG